MRTHRTLPGTQTFPRFPLWEPCRTMWPPMPVAGVSRLAMCPTRRKAGLLLRVTHSLPGDGALTLPSGWNDLTVAQQNAHRIVLRIDVGTSEGDWAHTPTVGTVVPAGTSGSRIWGFRVPGASNQVDGGRLTVTRGAGGKVTGLSWQITSGGLVRALEFVREPGLYYEG